MKTFLYVIFCCLFYSLAAFGQKENKMGGLSLMLSNGISNRIYFDRTDKRDLSIAYVNGIGVNYAIETKSKIQFLIGLQYGKNGRSENSAWEDDTGLADLEERYGQFPIQIKTVEWFHYASLIASAKFYFPRKTYLKTGLSYDVLFGESSITRYKSYDDRNTKLKHVVVHGSRRVLLGESSWGANVIVGKVFPINKRWNCLLELEYKMYNLLPLFGYDDEDSFLKPSVKPFVIGINLGIQFMTK